MPGTPRYLGHLLNRVKLRKGKPPKDKEKKITLIEAKLTEQLKKLTNFRSPNLQFHLSPTIKEFDRFNDRAIEEGVAMAFMYPRNLVHTSKKEEKELDDQRTYYFSCYASAIMSVFSNLSEMHQRNLKLRFKTRLSPLLPLPGKAQGRCHREMFTFAATEPDEAMKGDMCRFFEGFLGENEETLDFIMNDELIVAHRQLPSLERALKGKINNVVDKETRLMDDLFERFELDLEELRRGKQYLSDIDRLVLISQLSAPRKKDPKRSKANLASQKQQKKAVKFMDDHISWIKSSVELQDELVRYPNLIRDYRESLNQRVFTRFTKQYYLVFAKSKTQNLRFWRLVKKGRNEEQLNTLKLVEEYPVPNNRSQGCIDVLLGPHEAQLLRIIKTEALPDDIEPKIIKRRNIASHQDFQLYHANLQQMREEERNNEENERINEENENVNDQIQFHYIDNHAELNN